MKRPPSRSPIRSCRLAIRPNCIRSFRASNPGELSQPIQIDSGFVIITLKEDLPAHQGTLAEVHDQVLADYQQEKSIDLAARPRAGALQARQVGRRFRQGREIARPDGENLR